jgi:hypothetical protein
MTSYTHQEAESLKAELRELASQVLEYKATAYMVAKEQTAHQRRTHQPAGESKRWYAGSKIAGLTWTEFAKEFGLEYEIHTDVGDDQGRYYTKKEAVEIRMESCEEEFVRFMFHQSYDDPETFKKVVAFLKKEEIK